MGSTAGLSNDNSEDVCVICLSSVTERAITVPCNHYTFDFVCLISWLQQRSACPLCMHVSIPCDCLKSNNGTGNTQITAVQYDWRSPTEYETYAVPQSHPTRNAQPSHAGRRTSLFAPYELPGRPRRSQRPYSPPVEDTALSRRRQVYQRKLYSLHMGSNPYSGYRDITPQMIAASPDLQSRARTWIRRELRVFTFLYTDAEASSSGAVTTSSNAEFLLSYIVSILKMVELKASNGHAENLLSESLGRDNARLFLHELGSWLRSPYKKVNEWDEEVQYRLANDENLDG